MPRWLLRASVRRTASETGLIALGVLLLVTASSYGIDLLWLGIGAVCGSCWAALRLRFTSGLSLRLLADDMLVVALCLLTLLVLGGGVWGLTALRGGRPSWLRADGALVILLIVGGSAVAAGGARVGVRLLVLWLRLRKTRYLWSLTNSILLAALLVASPFVLLLIAVQIPALLRNADGPAGLALRAVPLVGLVFGSAVALMIVVLPAALVVAFFVARRLNRRLDALTRAASEMRAGNYAARIVVEGQDEIAQLQHTFNALAGDLDEAVRDLKAERDSVTALLDARRHLIASVSHELRTPVATLRGYLDAAVDRGDGVPPTLHQDLATMQRETARLQSLIDDLFTLSRAEVGHLDVRPQPTDLNALVERCVATITPTAWRSGRVEVLAAPAAQPALAHVDAARTEQIVYNLLHNAVRHTGPGGIVVAGVVAGAADIAIEVKDTGEGIAPDDLPRIWERFYRAGSQRAGSGGTGLGLALVKELAEAMGGSVGVTSTPGAGSSFQVHLPYAR